MFIDYSKSYILLLRIAWTGKDEQGLERQVRMGLVLRIWLFSRTYLIYIGLCSLFWIIFL